MNKHALWFLFVLVMVRPAMAQGETIAPVQTPTLAQTVSAATVEPGQQAPPTVEQSAVVSVPAPAPTEKVTEATTQSFFGGPHALDSLISWFSGLPLWYFPLAAVIAVISYVLLLALGLLVGSIRRQRARQRLAEERCLTRAERQKHMRQIIADVVLHKQAKYKYETGLYHLGTRPPEEAPSIP